MARGVDDLSFYLRAPSWSSVFSVLSLLASDDPRSKACLVRLWRE
jgi:hypothetical protein